MKKKTKRYVAGGGVALAVVLAVVAMVVQRVAIAGLPGNNAAVMLAGIDAQDSPQAQVVIDFMEAFRMRDMAALPEVTTPAKLERIEQHRVLGAGEFKEKSDRMLADLPSNLAELLLAVARVQGDQRRCTVSLETDSTTWRITVEQARGAWRVADFQAARDG